MKVEKIKAVLYGGALGDACGAPTEFMPYRKITETRKVGGAAEFAPGMIYVTDDTQMTMALAEAFMECLDDLTPKRITPAIVRHFVAWSISPDNTRAPGLTCLQSCAALLAGLPWQSATLRDSKGCGANMRVAPVALLAYAGLLTPHDAAGLAQLQAVITHGHPTAAAASDLTAWIILYILRGGDLDDLPDAALAYCRAQVSHYRADWLGDYADETWNLTGWRETYRAVLSVKYALVRPDRSNDPCAITGEGWTADEALAGGLLCFLLYRDAPARAIQRAAMTSGDSDSIATLAGQFAGASSNLSPIWSLDWIDRLEYRARLDAFADALGDVKPCKK